MDIEIPKLEIYLPRSLEELAEIERKPTLIIPAGNSDGEIFAYFGRDEEGYHEFIKQFLATGYAANGINSYPISRDSLVFTKKGISIVGIGRTYTPKEDGFYPRMELLEELNLWERSE